MSSKPNREEIIAAPYNFQNALTGHAYITTSNCSLAQDQKNESLHKTLASLTDLLKQYRTPSKSLIFNLKLTNSR